MIAIRDLQPGTIYRHDTFIMSRWIVVRKEPAIGGFEVESAAIQSGVLSDGTTTKRYDPDDTWPVVEDNYVIEEFDAYRT